MSEKTARIITFAFGCLLFIAAATGIVQYKTSREYNATITERFVHQLPKVNDSVKILVSRAGKITEKKAGYMVKTFFMAIGGLILLYLTIKAPKTKHLEKRG